MDIDIDGDCLLAPGRDENSASKIFSSVAAATCVLGGGELRADKRFSVGTVDLQTAQDVFSPLRGPDNCPLGLSVVDHKAFSERPLQSDIEVVPDSPDLAVE